MAVEDSLVVGGLRSLLVRYSLRDPSRTSSRRSRDDWRRVRHTAAGEHRPPKPRSRRQPPEARRPGVEAGKAGRRGADPRFRRSIALSLRAGSAIRAPRTTSASSSTSRQVSVFRGRQRPGRSKCRADSHRTPLKHRGSALTVAARRPARGRPGAVMTRASPLVVELTGVQCSYGSAGAAAGAPSVRAAFCGVIAGLAVDRGRREIGLAEGRRHVPSEDPLTVLRAITSSMR